VIDAIERTPTETSRSRSPSGMTRDATLVPRAAGTPILLLDGGGGAALRLQRMPRLRRPRARRRIRNVFLGDDGFGVAVVDRLSRTQLPDWVKVAD
jgi:hypothetical protein